MFKYSLNCKGDREILTKFSEELDKLGYSPVSSSYIGGEDILCINEYLGGGGTIVGNGNYKFYSTSNPRDYIFNIDNEWEFNAALGIAAIRDNQKWNVGEYFWHTGDGYLSKIHKIENGRYHYHKAGSIITGTNFGIDTYAYTKSRKATPEEIIEHFKPKQHTWEYVDGITTYGLKSDSIKVEITKTEKMKEIIGYKADKDYYDGAVKKGTTMIKAAPASAFYYPDFNIGGFPVPKEIVEGWEPVYKEEEYKVGDWIFSESGVMRIEATDEAHYFELNHEPPSAHHGYSKKVLKNGDIRRATPEEIEKHLIEVAKEKGFVYAVRFTSVRDSTGDDWEIGSGRAPYRKENGQIGDFKYHADRDLLITHGNGLHVVYEKGVWATISPREKEIVVGSNGVKVTIGKDKIKSRELYPLNYKIVHDLYEAYDNAGDNFTFGERLNTYQVLVDEKVRFIRIGCETENHLFSLEDLKLVIDTYKELNK